MVEHAEGGQAGVVEVASDTGLVVAGWGFDTHILAATRLLNAQPAPSPTHPRLGRAGLAPALAAGRLPFHY